MPTAGRRPTQRPERVAQSGQDPVGVTLSTRRHAREPGSDRVPEFVSGADLYGPEVDDIERWFVARGLPHFVERRDSAWEIWGRAAPLLAVAYLLLGLYALDLSEWSLTENLVAGAAVVAA